MMIRSMILGFVSVAILAALGFGFWWFNAEVLAPQRVAVQAAESEDAAATPPPEDPSLAVWRSLAPVLETQPPEEALASIRTFLQSYPESPSLPAALEQLNRSSTKFLFTDYPAIWKQTYEVVSGDSLAKVAGRDKVSMDWVMKVNNLLTHNLQIGQKLLLPKLEIRIVADRPGARLDVYDADGILLSYPMVDSDTASQLAGETAVRERIVTSDGDRVPFAHPGYAGGEKTIALTAGVGIEALPQKAADGETPAMSRGLLLEPADFEELFLLVRSGTPVEIR